MTTGRSNIVDLSLHLHAVTEKAILVSENGDKDKAVWLPKSQVEYEEQKSGYVEVQCPEWLANDKGLI